MMRISATLPHSESTGRLLTIMDREAELASLAEIGRAELAKTRKAAADPEPPNDAGDEARAAYPCASLTPPVRSIPGSISRSGELVASLPRWRRFSPTK